MAESIPGGYPVTPEHEKTIESIGNDKVENNVENSTRSNAKSGTESNVESGTKSNAENDARNNVESGTRSNAENGAESNLENDTRNNAENGAINTKNGAENNAENNARKELESTPFKLQPNPSLKPTDDNNVTRVSHKGSSALGGIGINPAAVLGGGSDSPPHPHYQNESQKSDEPQQVFDYNNEQKEREQDKLGHETSEEHRQKPKDKKGERIDLGVKPLDGQQLPLPYKPEKNTDPPVNAHKQTEGTKRDSVPTGKTTAVHPEDGPKITKKDKVNAKIDKAVGTLKEKVGKLVRKDSLVAKGTEQKAEADKTKELAEVQKMNEI